MKGLKKITEKELEEILIEHKLWKESNEEEGKRADLRYTDLKGFNLFGADLYMADLFGANLDQTILCGANLGWANLQNTHLCEANLDGAYLRSADLRYTILVNTSLVRASLMEANLQYTHLYKIDLQEAILNSANFNRATLEKVNLKDVALNGINFQDATLLEVKEIPYIPMICPEVGSFIGWKKTRRDKIVKLEIPEDALRSSSIGRKCRCNKAKVLAIENIDGTLSEMPVAISMHDNNFVYKVGEIVEEPNFCKDRWRECAPGIHFFINRQEAVNY